MAALRSAAVSLGWRPAPRAGERGALMVIAAGVVASWLLLAGMIGGGAMGHGTTGSAVSRMAGMSAMAGMPARSSGGHGSMLLGSGAAGSLAMWALMVVAMMVPAALPAVRYVATASLRWRRGRAIALFASVYVVVWIAFGAALVALSRLWSSADGAFVLAAALAFAVAWQLTPLKRRALRDCHRSSPLAPRGWRATTGVVRFASYHGFACVRSCWAMMLVMGVASSIQVFWMVALTGAITTEKLARRPRHATRVIAVALAVPAIIATVVAFAPAGS
jgi:predicted metal-binding membrane protein